MKSEGVGFYLRVGLYSSRYGSLLVNFSKKILVLSTVAYKILLSVFDLKQKKVSSSAEGAICLIKPFLVQIHLVLDQNFQRRYESFYFKELQNCQLSKFKKNWDFDSTPTYYYACVAGEQMQGNFLEPLTFGSFQPLQQQECILTHLKFLNMDQFILA